MVPQVDTMTLSVDATDFLGVSRVVVSYSDGAGLPKDAQDT